MHLPDVSFCAEISSDVVAVIKSEDIILVTTNEDEVLCCSPQREKRFYKAKLLSSLSMNTVQEKVIIVYFISVLLISHDERRWSF